MIGRAFHGGLALLRKYASIPLLAVGGLLLRFFVSIEFWSIVGPVLGVVIGSSIAIVGTLIGRFRDTEPSTDGADPKPLDARVPLLLASLYVLSMVVLFRFNTYHRPDLLYVLFGGYAGAIGYQIARGESRVRVVPQILVLAFFTYWSSQFLFPAGMYAPDTNYRYIPVIESVFSTYQIPASEARYAGHLAYVTEFAYLSGLSAKASYYLLATLVLVGTVLLLGMLDRVFPVLPKRVALYSALVFSVMSWMIGRGMHPNKLNFFYPIILLLGIVAANLYQSEASRQGDRRAWFTIGVVLAPAIIFGHRFSAGAGLVFLAVFGLFSGLSHSVLKDQYEKVPVGSPIFFVALYTIGILGNPLHQEALLSRIAGLVLAVLVTTGAAGTEAGAAAGGPGRYSDLPLDVLFVSTAAQTLLFALFIVGAIWMFRRSEWEYDYVLVWMGLVSLLLIVSIVTNSVDTAPQRFYALLGLFGFNICAGTVFYYLGRTNRFSDGRVSISAGRGIVAVVICVLAVTSLASPVADKATSPVSDDIPHFRQFDTAQLNHGETWTERFGSENTSRIVPPNTNVPIERTGRVTGRANTSVLERGAVYSYSALTDRTGVLVSVGLTFGGRQFVFADSPATPSESKVYTNGQTGVYRTEMPDNRSLSGISPN
ncbi:hypothetical protein C475_01232 [Halosimplex carlsbadense 2-9-1]|uniref:Glycosyltransferase RgtA/B/C/D-like domain-containing protein n=1 Tax=Halosimplex carlsbadense 2-9-1 TaxID=797114 RepID=M0D4D1_9EURY|nr:hypothetical protein [Halosimplex carlsbadense]ELZ30315.1 hypothetical protein C475_01232 [Halosimplex carlsbadense 2-9-1]